MNPAVTQRNRQVYKDTTQSNQLNRQIHRKTGRNMYNFLCRISVPLEVELKADDGESN